jgi:hypothetical protein
MTLAFARERIGIKRGTGLRLSGVMHAGGFPNERRSDRRAPRHACKSAALGLGLNASPFVQQNGLHRLLKSI